MRQSIAIVFNGLCRKSGGLLLVLAAAALTYALTSAAEAKPQNGAFITFDIPGGALDTFVNGINPAGVIAGTYVTETGVNLGFLRALNGSVITISVPGSTATFVGSGGPIGPNAGPPINPAGVTTGSYADVGGVMHGFVRAHDGAFATFDAPNSVNGTDFLCCITPEGAVAGISFDANFVGHGFLRAPNGTFAAFDPPAFTFTAPNGINPSGVITGAYFDVTGVEHGFLRGGDGTVITFDAPGAVNGTGSAGINPARGDRRKLF